MRRWRLPSLVSKRLRLPSSSGDETRSRLETRLVDRARGWPLVWFIFVGRGCGPSRPEAGQEGLAKIQQPSSIQLSANSRSRGRT